MNKKISIIGGDIIGVLFAFLLDSLYKDLDINLFIHHDVDNNTSLTYGDDVYNINSYSYMSTSSPLLSEVVNVCNQNSNLLAKQVVTSKFRKVLRDKKHNFFSNIPDSPHNSLLFNGVLFLGDRFRAQKTLSRPFLIREEMSIYDVFYEMCGKSFAESFATSLSRYNFSVDPSVIQFSSVYPEIYSLLKDGFSLRDALLHKEQKRKDLYKKYFSGANYKKSYYSFLSKEQDVVESLLKHLQSSSRNNLIIHKKRVLRMSCKKNRYTLVCSDQKSICDIDSVIITEHSKNIGKIFKETEHKLYKVLKSFTFRKILSLYSIYPSHYRLNAFYHTFSFKDKHSFYGLTNLALLDGFKSKKSTLLMSTLYDNLGLFSVDELANMVHKNYANLWKNKIDPLIYKIVEQERDFSHELGTKIHLDNLKNTLATSYENLFFFGTSYGMYSFQMLTDKMLESLVHLDKNLDLQRG